MLNDATLAIGYGCRIKTLNKKKRSVLGCKLKWWNLTGENSSNLFEKIKTEGNHKLTGILTKCGKRWRNAFGVWLRIS